MVDRYHIDLHSISLAAYEKELSQAELLPSRRILQENTKERFQSLKFHGLKNLGEVVHALGSPQKIAAFVKLSGLPAEFLKILKREISSFQPKPIKLMEIPDIQKRTLQILSKHGIVNSQQFFNLSYTPSRQKALSKQTGIPQVEIMGLAKLVDVTRIRWVGANFARLLADAGYDSVEKVQRANVEMFYNQLIQAAEKRKDIKGKFGLQDIKLTVLAAKAIPAKFTE
jgi:hypothetical protein